MPKRKYEKACGRGRGSDSDSDSKSDKENADNDKPMTPEEKEQVHLTAHNSRIREVAQRLDSKSYHLIRYMRYCDAEGSKKPLSKQEIDSHRLIFMTKRRGEIADEMKKLIQGDQVSNMHMYIQRM